MWIFVSYNRPERCRHALKSMVDAGLSTPGKLIVNGAKHEEYAEIGLPPDWERIHLPENLGLCGALNWSLCQFPHEPWYGTPTDDDEVYTHGFDKTLIEAAGSWCISHANDHWQSQSRLWSYCTYGGDLLRTIGQWFPDGLWHYYADDLYECIVRELGNRRWCKQINTAHKHHYAGTAPDDHTYQTGRSRWGEDSARFESWKSNEWQTLREKLKTVIPQEFQKPIENAFQ